ncbi:MAG TPA: oligosaccharide flippase family protein, partial [Pseudonocardiaceae bacterium]|nr:oligosaccharide flippase family protein [Pseudonocardiaceae bacterium]
MTQTLIGRRVPAMRAPLAGLRRDALVRNSFFLLLTTGVSAAAGFVFWIEVARLYSVTDVGRATSLLSAVTLLCYFSQFGLSSSLVRYLPTSSKRAEHVSSALTLVAVTGVLVALGFAALLPVVAPKLSFVTGTWTHIAMFAILTMCAAQNLLTDAVFVALRAARYNLLIDGALMGAAKLVLPL